MRGAFRGGRKDSLLALTAFERGITPTLPEWANAENLTPTPVIEKDIRSRLQRRFTMKRFILMISLVALVLAVPLTAAAENTRWAINQAWNQEQQQMKRLDARFKSAEAAPSQTKSIASPKIRQIGKYRYLCLNCPD
jgi:hypothetical protein